MKILFVVPSAFPTQKAYGVTTRESMVAAKNLGHQVYSLSLKSNYTDSDYDEITDRISVMYAGRIIEQGSTDKIINQPLHPYTQGLIKSVPSKNKKGEKLHQIDGMVPSMFSLPKGCAFEERCYLRSEQCKQEEPSETQHTDGRFLRCLNIGKQT